MKNRLVRLRNRRIFGRSGQLLATICVFVTFFAEKLCEILLCWFGKLPDNCGITHLCGHKDSFSVLLGGIESWLRGWDENFLDKTCVFAGKW